MTPMTPARQQTVIVQMTDHLLLSSYVQKKIWTFFLQIFLSEFLDVEAHQHSSE